MIALAWPTRTLRACCDDFWTCAEAVATGGLSCAVEAALGVVQQALNAAQALLANVNATTQAQIAEQNAALQAVLDQQQAVINNTKAEARVGEQLLAAYSKTVIGKGAVPVLAPGAAGNATAAEKTGEGTRMPPTPPNGGVAPGASALHGSDVTKAPPTLEQALAALRAELAPLLTQEQKLEASTGLLEAKAATERQASIAAVTAQVYNLFTRPLGDAIAAMQIAIKSPDQIVDFAGRIGKVVNDLGAIESTAVAGVFSLFHDRLQKVADLPAASVEQLDALRAKIAKVDNEIAELLAKERIAEAQQLLSNAHRLSISNLTYVPGQHPVTKVTTSRVSAFTTTFGPSLASIQSQLRPYMKPLQGHDTSAYPGRMAPQWNQYFAGMSKPAGVLQRDALLAEARQRFASKPETLKAVEALIRREAAARGVS